MAITRAQQARQMLEDGGPMRKIKGQDHMLAYITPNEADKLVKLGGQETMTPEGILAYPEFDNYSGPNTPGGAMSRSEFEGGAYQGTGSAGDGVIEQYNTPNNTPKKKPPVIPKKKPKKTKKNTLPTLSTAEKFKVFNLKKLYDKKMGLTPNVYGVVPNLLQAVKPPELTFYEESDPEFDATYYGMSGDDITDADILAEAINEAEKTGNITQTEFENAFYGPEGPPQNVVSGGDGQVMDPCKGPNPPAYCNVNNTTDPADPKQILSTRILGSQFNPTFFANEGGRAELAEGGIMPRLSDLSGNISSAEQMLQEINQRLQSAESTLGEGSGGGMGSLPDNFQRRQMPIGQIPNMSPFENAMRGNLPPNNQFNNATLPATLKPAIPQPGTQPQLGPTGKIINLDQPFSGETVGIPEQYKAGFDEFKKR